MPEATRRLSAIPPNLHAGWKTIAAITCFAVIGMLPLLAIAHPALVVPLAAAPLGLIIMVRIPVWLVLGFVAFTFFRLHEAIPALLPLRIPQLLAIPTLVVLVWHIGIKQRPKVLSAVLAVIARALSGDVIRRAGQRRREAEIGVVTFIQRFGSALNLNIHLHMLAPDGAWHFVNGKAHFHRAPAPSDADIERLLARLIRRANRCLLRAGVLVVEAEQSYLDVDTAPDDALVGLAEAAVRYRIAVGSLAGQRTMRLRVPAPTEALYSLPGSLTANHEGFSLNAAVACGA